jgi:UDP-glucose 4-epimerase
LKKWLTGVFDLKMKKILVTGGTGYIGSHTVVELQQSGYQVVIIDNLSNSHADVVGQIDAITGIRPHFEQFDLRDEEKVMNFFSENRDLSGIIHFAAFKSVGASVAQPLQYYHNNLLSTINLLKGMKEYRIKNLVFSSSCTVYGQPDELPVSENAPVREATSPYGHTKQISEQIIQNTCKAVPVHAILLRYFNPVGAHDSALIGELPTGVPDNLVPYITQTAVGKHDSLKVFGQDYDTPDGTAIRDYIHVVDLARAHVLAMDRQLSEQQQFPVEVFNLGTGRGYSVMEVIKSFEKISGIRLNYKMAERRKGDIEKVWADTTRANEVLGWSAGRGLDEMILSAWNWELALKKSQSGW